MLREQAKEISDDCLDVGSDKRRAVLAGVGVHAGVDGNADRMPMRVIQYMSVAEDRWRCMGQTATGTR
ncbi:hypothetical protein E4U15_005751 [Claviceps sp. LM218 group G6]|nr:hypothetical protein E4U15_005751 [Claviceps sp. LM218 group G6]